MLQHSYVRSHCGLSLQGAVHSHSYHWIRHGLIVLLLLLAVPWAGYGTAQAANGDPTLSIPTATVNVMNGSTISLPITFADAATTNNISALSFSLDFDESCLTFDSVTDMTSDGIPDAVTGLPAGYVTIVTYDASDTGGEIDLSISDQTNPQDALEDGILVTFEFGLQSSCRTTDGTTESTPFAFDTTPSPTFGNLLGAAVTGGTHTNGTYTVRFNAKPTNIALSVTAVDENVALATEVGVLSSTDPDADLLQTHTYNLVNGAGDTDNGSFVLDGSTLTTNAVLNYELKSSYSIRLRTTDNLGGIFEKAFTVSVTDLNEAPTSISIGNSSVAENAASDATVGSFASVDQDAGATASYSLVSGIGETDNGSFVIVAGVLKAAAVFNYEVKNGYNIRVRVTDNGTPGLTFENVFTIRINNVNDAPVAVADVIDPDLLVISVPTDIFVLTNDIDQDSPHALTVSAFVPPSSGTVVNNTTSLNYTPAADFHGVVSFSYTASDGTATDEENVTLTVVANDARGDCNSDGAVNAGDFSALVLENLDTDTVGDKWYQIYQLGFAGSPMGCDANVSKSITIADLTCAVLVSFGNTVCTTSIPVMAAHDSDSNSPEAELVVGQTLASIHNGTVDVPIHLTTNGEHVAAVSFAINFDSNQLAFDGTDTDHNGLPDAVTFHTQPGMVTMANFNQVTGLLEVSLYGVTVPMPTLNDGLLASVTLQVNVPTTLTELPIVLEKSSLGSDQGQAVPVQVTYGAMRIVALNQGTFLPTISR